MSERITPQDVLRALAALRDAERQQDIVALGMVKDVEVGDNRVSLTLQVPNPQAAATERWVRAARQVIQQLGVAEVQVGVAPLAAPGPNPQAALIPQVKYTIAVASGKGGVGKSTVAANLAVALALAGNKVGLMDADVYGPSIPTLMGGRQEPRVVDGKIEPPVEFGVKMISMGYFLPKNDAVIWRGPMLHKTVRQFLGDVRWGELDFLMMDLPPGTGDIQLSLCQTVALTGAVIVSTPQDLALNVASKAIGMFQKLNVPILGLVENMSYYVCPGCGRRDDIFGHGGARQAAEKLGFPFLGEIPLDVQIRAESDGGRPVAVDRTTACGQAFHGVAARVVAEVDARSGEVKPDILIE
jgi:ATP-binding protein involved in chromosome partitioning